jgi:hypothetical protein
MTVGAVGLEQDGNASTAAAIAISKFRIHPKASNRHAAGIRVVSGEIARDFSIHGRPFECRLRILVAGQNLPRRIEQ